MIASTDNTPEMFVVEWSPLQQCVHVDTLSRMIVSNQRRMMEGDIADYWPVFISQSEDEARAFANGIQSRRDAIINPVAADIKDTQCVGAIRE